MAFTVTEVRADVNALLATAVDGATWTTALLDEGVRGALLWYATRGPLFEGGVTVAAAGAEQDLSTLPDLLVLEAVRWPWQEGQRWEQGGARWRSVGHNTVRFDTPWPAAGDTIRVRYRKLQRVSGLDGAATTTVPDAHRRLIVLAAGAHAVEVRLRQISENPALPQQAAGDLRLLYARLNEEAGELMEALCGPRRTLVWPGVGL